MEMTISEGIAFVVFLVSTIGFALWVIYLGMKK